MTSSPGDYSTAQATGQGSSAGGSEATGSAAGEQVASTDGGAIRVISPSDLATSGIDNANAATATDSSVTETGKARNPFLNDSGGLGGSQNGKVIGGSVAGIVAVLVIVVAVIWLLGKVSQAPSAFPVAELRVRCIYSAGGRNSSAQWSSGSMPPGARTPFLACSTAVEAQPALPQR